MVAGPRHITRPLGRGWAQDWLAAGGALAMVLAMALAVAGCDKASFAPLVIDREFAGSFKLAEATPILAPVPCQVSGQDGTFQVLEIAANTIDHYFTTVIGSQDCSGADKISFRFSYLVDNASSQPADQKGQRLKTAIFHHYIRVESSAAANTLNLEGACGKSDWLKGEYSAGASQYQACVDASAGQLGRYITSPPKEADYTGSIIELTPYGSGISVKTQKPSASTATTRYFLPRR